MKNKGQLGSCFFKSLIYGVAMIAILGYVQVAFAAVELTLVSGDATWTISPIKWNTAAPLGGPWTIRGSTSGTVEDIDFRATSASWTASTNTYVDGYGAPGSNRFSLRFNSSVGTIIPGTNVECISALANNTTSTFNLWFKSPTTPTADVANLLITITITARAH